MLRIEIPDLTKDIEIMARKVSDDFPLSEVSKQVRDDIVEYGKGRGWKHIKSAVIIEKVNKFLHVIHLGGEFKERYEFQHDGTKDHTVAPRNKKALHWKGKVTASKGLSAKMKTGDFFSRGHKVTGIRATNFFNVYDSTVKKIDKIIDDFLKKI